jgi:hypothetical protein
MKPRQGFSRSRAQEREVLVGFVNASATYPPLLWHDIPRGVSGTADEARPWPHRRSRAAGVLVCEIDKGLQARHKAQPGAFHCPE